MWFLLGVYLGGMISYLLSTHLALLTPNLRDLITDLPTFRARSAFVALVWPVAIPAIWYLLRAR